MPEDKTFQPDREQPHAQRERAQTACRESGQPSPTSQSQRVFRRRGYAIIDVTGLTIEQTFARIFQTLRLRP